MINQPIPRLFYSINEIALGMAGIDRYEHVSVSSALACEHPNAYLADDWRVTIKQHILDKRLLLDHFLYQRFGDMDDFKGDVEFARNIGSELINNPRFRELKPDLYHFVKSGMTSGLMDLESCFFNESIRPKIKSDDSEMFSSRMISTKELIKWSKGQGITLWFDDSNLAIDTDQIPKAQVEPPAIGTTNIRTPQMEHIENLLAGNHPKQAPELQIALKAWLEAIEDKTIIKNVKAGIDRHIPKEIDKTATRDRLSKVINWNKSGNR